MERKRKLQVKVTAGLLALLCSGLMAVNDPGCCNKPNAACPPTFAPVKGIHFVAYGDSIVKRYQNPLASLLVGDLGKEGVSNRTAFISRYTRANSQNRCDCAMCTLAFDCLCAFPPLGAVQERYADADTLVITLGGNDLKEDVLLQSENGVPVSSKDPIVSEAMARLGDSLEALLDIAMTRFSPDRIYMTSYHYFPLDRAWGDCSPFATPLSPRDQKIMNELCRILDAKIRSVAQARGVHFISLLDSLGGGKPAGVGGETGPDASLFEDCLHPNPTGASIQADIIFNAMASE